MKKGEGMKILSESPSAKKEWIEMSWRILLSFPSVSPSAKKEWIEIPADYRCFHPKASLLLRRRSGLKYQHGYHFHVNAGSPSAKKEWIEIYNRRTTPTYAGGLLLRRRSGLKYYLSSLLFPCSIVSFCEEGVD